MLSLSETPLAFARATRYGRRKESPPLVKTRSGSSLLIWSTRHRILSDSDDEDDEDDDFGTPVASPALRPVRGMGVVIVVVVVVPVGPPSLLPIAALRP